MALAALACEVALVVAVLSKVPQLHWIALWNNLEQMTSHHWTETATGFAAAWLAFSGLESLGQLAPALREPRRRVIRIVAVLVVVSLVVTVPVVHAHRRRGGAGEPDRPAPGAAGGGRRRPTAGGR